MFKKKKIVEKSSASVKVQKQNQSRYVATTEWKRHGSFGKFN